MILVVVPGAAERWCCLYFVRVVKVCSGNINHYFWFMFVHVTQFLLKLHTTISRVFFAMPECCFFFLRPSHFSK